MLRKLFTHPAIQKLMHSEEPNSNREEKQKGQLIFVIQEHHARRLHYDLRLEAEGVLKSWAVPKQPSMDPAIKRLAIQVEDHPYAYRNFAGIIPSGYGAGTVTIWDAGTYSIDGKNAQESERLLLEGLKKGSLHFSLQGKKLSGIFSLVRMSDKKNHWLFMKKQETAKKKE